MASLKLRTYGGYYVSASAGSVTGACPSSGDRPADPVTTALEVCPIAPSADGRIYQGARIQIRSHDGSYLSAVGGGGGGLTAIAGQPGVNECFTVFIRAATGLAPFLAAGCQLSLRSVRGMWVSAEGGGGGAINANRSWWREWETFCAVDYSAEETPQVTQRVRIELAGVTCRDTEDLTGADEFYLAGMVKASSGSASGIVTSPININNDGQTRSFSPDQTQLFDREVEPSEAIAVRLWALDEDVAHDWVNRSVWANAFAAAAAGIAVEGLIANPGLWGYVDGLALAAFAIAKADRDDLLGNLRELVPAVGPAEEVRTWHFAHGGWYSSWDYDVAIRVTRTRVGGSALGALEVAASPGELPCTTPVTFVVTATDSNSHAAVPASVYAGGRLVGQTGQSMTTTIGGVWTTQKRVVVDEEGRHFEFYRHFTPNHLVVRATPYPDTQVPVSIVGVPADEV